MKPVSMQTENKRPACPHCGSVDLSVDAIAEWNIDEQRLDFKLDQIYCNDCHELSSDYDLIPCDHTNDKQNQ
jgi:Zn finger protein HypA/HybF involved in hydrogenase expression